MLALDLTQCSGWRNRSELATWRLLFGYDGHPDRCVRIEYGEAEQAIIGMPLTQGLANTLTCNEVMALMCFEPLSNKRDAHGICPDGYIRLCSDHAAWAQLATSHSSMLE